MASPVIAGQAESSTPTAGTNHVLNWTGLGTVAAGDLLLILMDIGSTSATMNAHGSYTELLDESVANGLKIWYRWATGGETAPTFVSSAATRSAEVTYRITGAENPATQAPEIGTTATGTSTTPDPPAAVMTGGSKDYLVFAFFGMAGEQADDNTIVTTFPTNYTSGQAEKTCGVAGTNLGGMIGVAARALTASAENPGTFTAIDNAAWRAQTVTIHPNSSVSATPTPGTVAALAAVPAVTITATATPTPGVVTAVAAVDAVTVQTGTPATVPAPEVAALAAVPTPTVLTETNVAAPAVAAVAAVPAVTITASATVLAPEVAAVASVPAVTVDTGAPPAGGAPSGGLLRLMRRGTR